MRPRAAFSLPSALLALACSDEFAPDPPSIVTLNPDRRIADTMTVTDSDTLFLDLLDAEGRPVTAARVSWTSSEPDRLELQPVTPSGVAPADSLAAQLRVVATAHRRGRVAVTAILEQPGLGPLTVEDSVTILERWTAVTTGGRHTCGLTISGDAYCWGGKPSPSTQGSYGLGTGTTAGRDIPSAVLGSHKFVTIRAGDDATCGVTPVGLAYCWGRNGWGEIGTGEFDPVLVPTLSEGGRTFSQISTRTGLTCGITDADFLEGEGEFRNTFCWGRTSLGQLGLEGAALGPFGDPCRDFSYGFACVPKPLHAVLFPFRSDFVMKTLSVGADFICGIAKDSDNVMRDGEVWCWGLNSVGQLGEFTGEFPVVEGGCAVSSVSPPPDSLFFPCAYTPGKLAGGHLFTALSSGGRNTCGVTTEQALYCWGERYGATPVRLGGTGEFKAASVGGAVQSLTDPELSHACALTVEGQAYCWGDNVSGEIGNGEIPPEDQPTFHGTMQQVQQGELTFTSISAGMRLPLFGRLDVSHTCAVTDDGALYCWGDNGSGALGNPSLTQTARPARIAEPSE